MKQTLVGYGLRMICRVREWMLAGVFPFSYIIVQMSFASNNSRNVANLLRYEPIDPLNPPILPKRNLPTLNAPPTNQPPSRQRREIPVEEAFTPQEAVRQRKRTPLVGMRQSNREDEAGVQALRVRLEQIVRYYDQRHSSLESKMAVRLNELENFVMREVPRVDNSATVSADLIGLKDALADLRRAQQHQAAELSALRSASGERNGADALAQLSKEKEKSTVLFMEVVRLGDTVEKMSDYVSNLSRGYEGRYQQLQAKLSSSEKALASISQRSSSGSEVLSELGEKLMARLGSSESNLLLLGKEQVKDKEAIARLMAQNDRIGEDLQLLLRNMQADFQSKLENRVQETVNRLMMEHEERIRSTEEIKKNLDLRERVNAEKLLSERMDNKAKYDTMDALVRNELIRKEESIRSLHKAMEDQFRIVVTQLQDEAARRSEQQATFRGQIKHVQQNLRKEYDLYKNHQGELVDKITDMIKSEIDVRLATQLDLKKLTSSIAHEIVNDVNNLKEALSTSNKKLSFALREASSEAAERAGQLSHYVDAEVKKVVEVVTEKYSKMKSVFTKLAQQLRDHLQNTQQNRKNVESRLTAIEEDFDKLKNEVNGEIDEFYSDLEARLKEEKEFVETVVFKKTNELTVRVSKLQEYTNQHFDLLKAGIEDNKDILNKRISKIDDAPSSHNEEEMKNLRNFIFDIKRLTEELRTENDNEFRQLRKELQASEGRGKDEVFAVESKLSQRLSKSQEKEKSLEEQINELTLKVNALRADTNAPSNSISQNKAKKLADDVRDVNERVTDNEKLVEKIAGEITVLRAQINSLEGRLK